MRRTWKTDIGFSFLLASTIVFYITFLAAYVNPNHRVTIDINYFGEGNIEFLLIIGSIPLILLTIIEYRRTKHL